MKLLTKAQGLNQPFVSFQVFPTEILEQTAPETDHPQETAARVVIFGVRF
jgi:hypothetical protein